MKYRYRESHEMKDSGVEWLGMIPKEWKVSKVKYHFNFDVGGTPTSGKEEFYNGDEIWVTISDIKDVTIYDSKNKLSKKGIKSANLKKIKKGSLLYSFKLSVGQVAFAGNDLYTNEAIASFPISLKKYNLNFWYYSFSVSLINNASENIYGAKLMNQQLINNAKILFPNLITQQKIADFLDKKCEEFDSVISKKEMLINKLEEAKKSLISEVVTGKVKVIEKENGEYGIIKREAHEMKDSGVEWLGMIPTEWSISRLKHLANINNGTTPSRDDKDYWNEGTIPWLSSGKVNEFIIKNPSELITSKAVKECSLKIFPKNTILMGIVGQGKTRGTSAILKIDACINQNMVGIITNNKLHCEYLLHFLTQAYTNIRSGNGAGQEALNINIISNFKIPIPIFEKQVLIASFLKKNMNNFNLLIQKNKDMIEKLKSAKQSLISEVVTGKIEVL